MTTRYAYGRALEYQIQAELGQFGYTTMRSSGSKGLIDVIAMRQGEYLFIQAKRNGRLDPGEWNALYRLAQENHAKAILALKKESGIGNRYWLLCGEKIPRSRERPLRVWIPSERGQGAMFQE